MATKTSTLKHREITHTLRHEIQSGIWQGGDQLPGEQELARRFKVSYMTMRQAVTNVVQEGLVIRVRGKGTFVVSQDDVNATKSIGLPMALLFPSTLLCTDPYYFPEVLKGFQQEMEERGRRVALHDYGVLDSGNVLEPGSAVACLLIERACLRVVERARDAGHKVLGINRYTGTRSIPCVRINDAEAIEQAVGHLVALGHERIGFLQGPHDNLDASDRLRGFRSGVMNYGVRTAFEAGEGYTEAEGYVGAQSLLSTPNRPTALVCASDLSAIGAMKAARDCGLSVPLGLSVVGFGDYSVAEYVSPRLTTIRQTRRGLGQAAAQALIRLADGEDATDVLINAELIVRDSTVQSVGTMVAVG